MDTRSPKEDSLRERKRRETLKRIAEVGLRLFIARGYEATTLEMIAAEAGISRRTFFYYYKSKEEVLHAWQGTGFVAALRPALLEESSDQAPLAAVCHCLLRLVSRFETKESIIVDRMLQSSETLRTRKQASYVEMEQIVFDALCKLYPQQRRRPALRVIAMVTIGAVRLAMETWRQEQAKRPLADYLRKQFDTLQEEI
jgi:AcrR family transcriptional regulator